MHNDQQSTPLSGRLRSFRISDFTLRDLPLLLLAFASLTVLSLVLAWALKFLSPDGRCICLGLSIGFYLGMSFSSWRHRSRTRSEPHVLAITSENEDPPV